MKHGVTVLVFGTFDLLHRGHRSFLQQAAGLGDSLIVAVGRDSTVRLLKKHRTIHNERQRRAAVAALPFVTRAMLASKDPRRRYSFIKKLHPDVIALGYDQSHYTENLGAELAKRGIHARIIRLRPHRPHLYKTTVMRKTLAP